MMQIRMTWLWVFLCAAGCGMFAACGTFGSASEDALKNDLQAQAVLKRIDAETRAQNDVSNAAFEALRVLRERYPESETVRDYYRNALVMRGDIAALEKLLLEGGKLPESPEDQRTLAKVYVQTGRFAEALKVLEPLIDSSPGDVELRSLAGLSYFRVGEMEKAAASFDAVWDAITAKKMVPEISLRGMVYFRQGKLEEAKKTLEQAAEIDPGHITTINGLSQVYKLLGEDAKARELSEKVAARQKQMAAETLKKSRQVASKMQLEAAWREKRYRDVIDIANELMKGLENPAERQTLMEYQFRSYKSLGMEREAELVRRKAQEAAQ